MDVDTARYLGILGYFLNNPYSDTFFPKIKPAPKKRFSNCPVCGTQRVNIYYHNGEWKCLKCQQQEKE